MTSKYEQIAIRELRKQEAVYGKLGPPTIAVETLKLSNLFELFDAELDKTIVEEHETRKTILLVALGGALTVNAESTSLNLMVHDDSGAGKDYIVRQVLKLLPQKWIVQRKRISPTVFNYWHNLKFEPEWTWDGKVFYNEDISNVMLNSDVFKVFSSAEIGGISASTITINNRAIELEIKGKPVMLLTIASASPNPELLRRFPICNLDTTEAQTKLILKRKAQYHARGIKPSYDQKIMDALYWLKPVKVKVPFAEKLVNVLNSTHIIIRTHFDRFIDYVKFAAAIHQFQRECDEDGDLIAAPEDYEIARLAMLKTTSNIFSIPLTKTQTRIIEIMKRESKENECSFSVGDLEKYISFISDRQLRRELDKLATLGFLEKDKAPREYSKHDVLVYKLLKQININLPSWEDLNIMSNLSNTSNMSFMSNLSNLVMIDKIDKIAKDPRTQELPSSQNNDKKNENFELEVEDEIIGTD